MNITTSRPDARDRPRRASCTRPYAQFQHIFAAGTTLASSFAPAMSTVRSIRARCAAAGVPLAIFALIMLLSAMLAMPAAQARQAPDKEWWSAIRRDDAGTIQRMLLRRTDPNVLGPMGNPALTQAVREQSWKVYDLLLKAPGIRIDEPNHRDETALMYLAILGETERAEQLIRAGAQVNRLGWTPLHYAASKARLDTATMLIRHKAIINAPGTDGTTPLMMAAYSGRESMVRLLLSHGADATMFNSAHETAADWARKSNSNSLAAKLEQLSEKVALERRGEPEAPAGAGSTGSTASASAGSTGKDDKASFSRYFDLDRFENEEPVR